MAADKERAKLLIASNWADPNCKQYRKDGSLQFTPPAMQKDTGDIAISLVRQTRV